MIRLPHYFSCGAGEIMGKFVSLKDDVSFKYLFLNAMVRLHFISDVLEIPTEEIRSVRLANTFLWRRYSREKQGILDVLIELNNSSKINIELQIRALAYWDKRCMFYLAKLFTEGLLRGEHYERLKRCVCISILGFNLDERPEYHRIYWLRDGAGYEFSDMLHAKTKNPGIAEAIREVREMRLGKTLKGLYDAHMKEIRDRNARDDYVRMEGLAEGLGTGRAESEDRLNRLYAGLINDKRFEDLERSIQDKAYREQLYKEYGI